MLISIIIFSLSNRVSAEFLQPWDLNSNSSFDIYDYNILINEYSSKYTIYDYSSFVTNYNDNVSHKVSSTWGVTKLGLTQSLSTSNSVDARTELPFAIYGTGARQLTLSTGFTYACWTPQNPLIDNVTLSSTNCFRTVGGGVFTDPAHYEQFKQWRRNYYGTFTAHIVQFSTEQRTVYINHGENKNEKVNSTYYQNTINPLAASVCYSGIQPSGVWEDCSMAYNAFVGLSWERFDEAHSYGMTGNNDIGPIVWPSDGYIDNSGTKTSLGLRHPHGFVDNGYFYVYYFDHSMNPANQGIKVARAPINDIYTLGSFSTYCNGRWVRSLPVNYDSSHIQQFYSQKGGCSSNILASDNSSTGGLVMSFAVAKINSKEYLSVEEWGDSSGQSKIRVRLSKDLVNWSPPVNVYIYSSGSNPFHYPLLVDKDARSNELIDPNEFYIIGTDLNSSVSSIKMQIITSTIP